MRTFTGIDKISLTTTNFQVNNLVSGHFGIDTSIKQGGNKPGLLLVDKEGNDVEAWKAYHNSPKGLGNYTISPEGLLVSFNPSKLHHPYHLVSTSDKKYHQSFDMISDELKYIGISCDLSDMKPCRIDIAAQKQMIFPVDQYQSAFRLLKANRMKNQREYEGGFLFANTQNQTMFYNKEKELQYQGIGGIMEGEKNFLRGEVRLINAKSVGTFFNISTIATFNKLSSFEVDNYYKSFLNKRIFSRQYVSDQLQLDFNTELQIMKGYMASNPNNAWKLYLMENNIDVALLKFGSLDNFISFLKEAGFERTRAFRVKKQLAELLTKKAHHDTRRGEVTTSTLLSELQEKFAA